MAYQRSSTVDTEKMTVEVFCYPSITLEQLVKAEEIVQVRNFLISL